MTTIWNNDKIIEFVKGTLGCACPDEVFKKIEAGKAAIAQFAAGTTRIVVGEKLLIYVVFPQSLSESRETYVKRWGFYRKPRWRSLN